jgi:hypothetical protein
VSPIEGAIFITNSSQSAIVDPFINSLEDDNPALILTPGSDEILTNQEITSSFVEPQQLLIPQARKVIQSSNFNPPFEYCIVDLDPRVSTEAIYKIKGKSDINDLSGTNGPKNLEIKFDVQVIPSTSITDINDIIKSTIKYGDKEVDFRIDNDEGFQTKCINNAGNVPLRPTDYKPIDIQQNPPFRQCIDDSAPTVHSIYTIKFGNTNIDNVLQVPDGRQDVEITLTNDLLKLIDGQSGELAIEGGNDHGLGPYTIESSCEMSAT